jgi:hypothetical protein
MPALNRDTSALLLIDFQSHLMLAIADGPAVVANAKRLLVVPFIPGESRVSRARARLAGERSQGEGRYPLLPIQGRSPAGYV